MTAYRRPLDQLHRSEIEELKSRFITSITRAESPEAARAFIGEIRHEMPNASHHVYAFRVGYGNSVTEGMSDDGEPAGTSGPPSLAVLRGFDIGDVVLVTTRYFGGTKLGTGGLVRAYSDSARTALESLETSIKAPKVRLGIDLPYSLYEQFKRLLVRYEGIIEDETFAGEISLILSLLEAHQAQLEAELTELSAGQVESILLERYED